MIKPFQEYVKENLVKKQLLDNQKGHALMEKAEKKLTFVKQQKITEDTAQFVFEDAYDVMREASTALMAVQG